jgi:GTP1/Obg family GTP-binding protein
MYVIGDKIPKSVPAEDIKQYILLGRAARIRAKKSDPYANCATKEQLEEAVKRDAKAIAESYKEKAKATTMEKLRQFHKEIVQIQFGLDPVPRVGDFYNGHTVTDVIETGNRVELYGVMGKLRKRELERIVEESQKPECLRDKMKRRGYRFEVIEVI